jgi:hypothetical protein
MDAPAALLIGVEEWESIQETLQQRPQLHTTTCTSGGATMVAIGLRMKSLTVASTTLPIHA